MFFKFFIIVIHLFFKCLLITFSVTVLGTMNKIILYNQNVKESLQYFLNKPPQAPMSMSSLKKLMCPSHPLNLISNSLMPLIKLRIVYYCKWLLGIT